MFIKSWLCLFLHTIPNDEQQKRKVVYTVSRAVMPEDMKEDKKINQ